MNEPSAGPDPRPPEPGHAGSADVGEELAVNRALWTLVNEQFTDAEAIAAWSADELVWGLFGNTERQLQALGDVAGLDVVELGCGTAFFSAGLARLGARPVGVDLTPAQLVTARRCQDHFGLSFPLVEADATAVPLPERSFDLVVSEYGACVWCDPQRWVPEAARLLRPGGRLVFMTNSVQVALCVPDSGGHAGDRLLRPQNRAPRVEWPGGGVEYHPSHGAWIQILRTSGFAVEALHELYAPQGAATPAYYEIATAEWASRWPVEDLWVSRLMV
jgi:SAM-dependent methyltransferase